MPRARTKAAVKKFETVMVQGDNARKGKVTRYDSPGQLKPKGQKVDDKVLNNCYPFNEIIDALGNPDKIKVTFEAA